MVHESEILCTALAECMLANMHAWLNACCHAGCMKHGAVDHHTLPNDGPSQAHQHVPLLLPCLLLVNATDGRIRPHGLYNDEERCLLHSACIVPLACTELQLEDVLWRAMARLAMAPTQRFKIITASAFGGVARQNEDTHVYWRSACCQIMFSCMVSADNEC